MRQHARTHCPWSRRGPSLQEGPFGIERACRGAPAAAIAVALALTLAPRAHATTYNVAADFTAITGAIAAASPGDTIKVDAGTATLPSASSVITIGTTKVGIKLIGAGAGQTILQKSAGVASGQPILLIGSGSSGPNPSGATLVEGFTFKNSGLTTAAATTSTAAYRGIEIRSSGTSATVVSESVSPAIIRSNEFLLFRDTGIAIVDGNFRYWEITDNLFDGSRLAMWINDNDHVKVERNTFRNYVVAIGQDPNDTGFHYSIRDNDLQRGVFDPVPSNYYGILLSSASAVSDEPRNWVISGNDIVGHTWGMYIYSPTSAGLLNSLTDVTVVENCFSGNNVNGTAASTTYGINNVSGRSSPTVLPAKDLDARGNWWGDASGPFHPVSNAGGLGDRITDNVLFSPWVTGTITASAGAGGSITPSGAVAVACGGDQTFEISADECYAIADILVDGVSVGPVATYTFTNVRADHTIEASFVLDTFYALTVAVVGDGEVTRDPDQASYGCGTTVQLTATPDAGWHFVGWSGDAAGSDNPLDVLMDGDKSITATFADLTPPTVTVISPNGGEVLLIGTPTKISWTAEDEKGVVSVDICLSRDNGATFEDIAIGLPNTGTYTWLVTPPASNTGPDPVFEAIVRVKASDGSSVGSDDSDGPFAIYDLATPTLLSLFKAAAVAGGVELRWQFQDAGAVRDVEVERSPSAVGPWVPVEVERRAEGPLVVALDRTAEPGRTYFYRLQVEASDGRRSIYGPVEGSSGAATTPFALDAVAPNPSRGVVRVDFTMAREARARLSVVDLQGREVAVLADRVFAAGSHHLTWDARAGRGAGRAGVCFVRMKGPGVDIVKRLAMIE